MPSMISLLNTLQYLCAEDKRMSEAGYYLATLQASVTHILEADLQYLANGYFTLSYLKNKHARLREEKMRRRYPFRSGRPLTQSLLSRVSLVVVALLSREFNRCRMHCHTTTTINISAAVYEVRQQ